MKKNLKLAVTMLCLALALVMSASYVGAAQIEEPTIQPLWDNTSSVSITLTFIEGVGYAEAFAAGDPGTTSVRIDVYVFRKVGTLYYYVTEKHETISGMLGGISCPFEADQGGTYYAEYTFTVTKGGVDEVITRDTTRKFE